MKRISFAWTTPALLAGRKTTTRRAWKDHYAAMFRAGELVEAWDRLPFVGGHCIATIRLRAAPVRESTARVGAEDWEAEGFAYMTEIGARVDGKWPWEFFTDWQDDPRDLWVVRFDLVGLGRIAE